MTEDEVAGSAHDSERTARYSDPITERGGWVGRGAVLYDTREPHARPCCARPDGRCLAHVVGVYEETTTGEVYYKVADGGWTTEEWIHGDDLLAIFEPAGWSVTGAKPTYLLTREHGVEDHHDLMTDGGADVDGANWECFKCGAEIQRHLSAYEPWDEVIALKWKPSSDDSENVEVSESGGKHPEGATRRFCSEDCLESFIQMDYSLKPRNSDTETEDGDRDA